MAEHTFLCGGFLLLILILILISNALNELRLRLGLRLRGEHKEVRCDRRKPGLRLVLFAAPNNMIVL